MKDLADGAVRYFWGTPAVTLRLKELNWLEGLYVSLGKLASEADEAEFGDFRFGIFYSIRFLFFSFLSCLII